MSAGEVVIVAQPGDSVALGVQRAITSYGGDVTWYRPGALGALDVALTDDTFIVQDRQVRAVLWRVSPEMPLAEDFAPLDQTFANAEIAATWIAALRLRGMTAVNRFDGEAWYSGLRSHYWRNRLMASGIAVTPVAVGDAAVPAEWLWSPYTTAEPCDVPERRSRGAMGCACHPPAHLFTSIAACGRILGGPTGRNVRRAAEMLHAWGVVLAALDADPDGRVQRVRVLPVLENPETLECVTSTIGGFLYDRCTAR